MKTDREEALRNIAAGARFHAGGSTGSSRTCFTMQVRDTTILARDVSIQAIYEFDRRTGVAVRYFGSRPAYYTINSVARLPTDIRDIILEIDQKNREGEYHRAEDPNWEKPQADAALTEDEIRAHLFVADFYRDNPM